MALYRKAITDGLVTNTQTWLSCPESDPAYLDWLAAGNVVDPFPQMISPQDLMAQFTPTDATAIQAAISNNVSFWLLWQSMTAQKDPMVVTNARFLQGWSALVQVLGADRMNAIAATLGVTVG